MRRPAGMPPDRTGHSLTPTPTETAWATGGVVFAGVLMLMNGVMAIFQGISALAEDDVWANLGDYVYKINLTGWGVILVVLGAVAALTGAGILRGAEWARMTGIFLAAVGPMWAYVDLRGHTCPMPPLPKEPLEPGSQRFRR
ncbi:hypothetical protein ACFYO2_15675 [Streptomyces sp. NPDC006602]|uniref:DUF7144 family membrane protein n=1 Tax=Streptomyces sp. NPDC006602 TaxID=3364751 RepID=UPI0036BF5B49